MYICYNALLFQQNANVVHETVSLYKIGLHIRPHLFRRVNRALLTIVITKFVSEIKYWIELNIVQLRPPVVTFASIS